MPIDGWQRRPIGELIALEYGASLPDGARSGDGYPVFGSCGEVGRHAKALIGGPGIVVGRKGTAGAVSWSAGPFWPIDTAYYVSPRQDLDLRWLYWQLSSLGLTRLDSSTGVPGLNRNDVYRLSVACPPSAEQRRIAEILDTADDAIQKTEALIAKLKQMKAGLLHDLLTRGLDDNGQLRDPVAHPEQFKDSPLGRVPKQWRIAALGSLCDLLNGLAFRPEDWSDRGTPIIRIQNLNGGGEFNYFAGSFPERYAIQPGRLLFSWSGNRGTSFGPYVWSGPLGVLNQHIFKVTPAPDVRAGWFYYALDEVRRRAERAAHGGSGLVHVRRGDLMRYLIATPEPDEQERLGDSLAAADDRIRAEEQYRDKLKQIKKGLMHDLLTGRVRVATG
jgi:type I restriction enzyme S subunit